MKKLICILSLFFLQQHSNAQDFLKTKGKQIVNSKGDNILLRGMGLGGWMLQEGYMLGINKDGQQYRIRERIESLIGKEKTAEFYNAWLSNHTSKADIDSLRAWGFNSVRLPMHYNLYTLPIESEKVQGTQTWLNKGFEMTDALVEWCKANNIYLILDLHAAPGGQGNDNNISDRDPSKPSLWESEANQQKTIAFWKKIAERYKNEPTIIAYDIINEPNWGFEDKDDKNGLKETKNEPLEKLMREITAAIREVDKNHIIIIEGNGWGNNYKGILDDGVWDDNMVLSFHKYWNFNDQESIAHILKTREDYNIPVWLGETGENSNTWFTQAIQLLESNNIGWAWWPLKKLGYNNPLQINGSKEYRRIVDYWNNKTKMPLQIDFYKTLMDFATSTHISKNIFHPDVVDAMMRQPFTNETRPFQRTTILNGSSIRAVDFDLGKSGFAYYDLDSANYRVSGKPGVGNKGATYRNDGVDIYSLENNSGYYVGSFEYGEWLQYTIDVKQAGKYQISFDVKSDSANSTLALLMPGYAEIKTLSIPKSSQAGKWTVRSLNDIPLKKGTQKIRLSIHSGVIDLQSLHFKRMGN
jgi:endoglucanase